MTRTGTYRCPDKQKVTREIMSRNPGIIVGLSGILLLAVCATNPSMNSAGKARSLAPPPAATVFGEPVPVTAHANHTFLLDSDDLQLRANKRLAYDMWRSILNAGQVEAGREEFAPLYMDPIYIQHNPNAATGRDGAVAYFAQRPDTSVDSTLEDPLVASVAEGDLVVQVLQEERPHSNKPGVIYYVAWFDMFRIKHGRVIEHWDTAS